MKLRNLKVYSITLKLSGEIWKIYIALERNLKYNIGNQVIRSIDSIGANIAEGYGRFHYKNSVKFYYNARGSLWKSKHWIFLLYKRGLINRTISIKFRNFGQKIKRIYKNYKK